MNGQPRPSRRSSVTLMRGNPLRTFCQSGPGKALSNLDNSLHNLGKKRPVARKTLHFKPCLSSTLHMRTPSSASMSRESSPLRLGYWKHKRIPQVTFSEQRSLEQCKRQHWQSDRADSHEKSRRRHSREMIEAGDVHRPRQSAKLPQAAAWPISPSKVERSSLFSISKQAAAVSQ